MPYHVIESRINSVEIGSAIRRCDGGIIGTYEQARKQVLGKLKNKQKDIKYAMDYVKEMDEKDVEFCDKDRSRGESH